MAKQHFDPYHCTDGKLVQSPFGRACFGELVELVLHRCIHCTLSAMFQLLHQNLRSPHSELQCVL
jgi:hypothetical protein